ncbi:MAG: membrane protein insertase YidC [Planctomycetaceae bacterium]|jgi:YidC/Oxa1 family membrane protein insertase
MDQKRLLLATVLSMIVVGGWYTFVVPRLIPPRPKPVDPVAAAEGEGSKNAESPSNPLTGEGDLSSVPDVNSEKPQAGGEVPAVGVPGEPAPELPQHPPRTVILGAEDSQSGFRQRVVLNSQGACIERVTMLDPKLVSLQKPHVPLDVLGAQNVRPRSLEMDIPQLQARLNRLNWELVRLEPAEAPHESALFAIEVEGLRIERRYRVSKVDPSAENPEAGAYQIECKLAVQNLTNKSRTINYVMQGPTGLVLENDENTSKFRDVVAGFLDQPGVVNHQLLDAKSISNGKTEEWRKPVQYIGLDCQYFAALLCPKGNAFEQPPFSAIRQALVGESVKANPSASEITVELTSVPLSLGESGSAAATASQEMDLFVGPKREEVLPPLSEGVIDYGNFLGMGRLIRWTARRLVKLLVWFQSITGSWGIAIVCLTMLVRAIMVPISIKQAQNAARMQEIAPKIAALKEKFKDDQARQMKEMHELYRRNNVRPIQMGCLPALLQMPIFIGLYQSLNHAVDLRMAPFLYFENLAAPDALAQLPFRMPLLGWTTFNLLPVIVYALFMVQQKLFTPPPANEEQEIQQKTMNFMMIFMLVMFYRVPAGLCVYFIVSSLWGITEKLLLPKTRPAAALATTAKDVVEPEVISAPPRRSGPSDREQDGGAPSSGGGIWSQILKAAEKPDPSRRSDRRRNN